MNVVFGDNKLNELINWLSNDSNTSPFNPAFQCENRDIFQARLDNLYKQISNPLLIAVCGEIGNNAFDHNLGNWRDVSGLFFNPIIDYKTFIFADRGQGIKKTLSKIIPLIKNDLEAIETAFTKVISGRSPEQRGNGLKFVASAVKNNNWELFFQSGNGIAEIKNSNLTFSKSSTHINGCLAVIKYH